MSLADELLVVAQTLLGGKRGRPKNAAIHRAISTAYYALFHRLIDAVVTRAVTDSERQAAFGRMFEHKWMKELCQRVQRLATLRKAPDSKDQLYPVYAFVGLPVAAELLQVVTLFTELQESRHQADYNRAARLTRTDAEDGIDSARKAFEALKAVETTPGGQAFLLLLLFGEPKVRLPVRPQYPGADPMNLAGKRVAVLVEQKYEELEVWYPVYRLREAGCEVVLVAPEAGKTYPSKLGYPAKADAAASDVSAAQFHAVVIPGGFAPDYIRRNEAMLKLVRDAFAQGKPVAAICHGPWVLCSTQALKGRTATGFHSIKDDMTNAGATFVDKEVVVDGNVITSRRPDDLPAFTTALLKAIGGA